MYSNKLKMVIQVLTNKNLGRIPSQHTVRKMMSGKKVSSQVGKAEVFMMQNFALQAEI